MFISGIVSLITFLALFHHYLARESFRRSGRGKRLILAAYVAIGSVIVRMLNFYFLEYTSVAGILTLFLFSAQADADADVVVRGVLVALFAMLFDVANSIFAKYLSDVSLAVTGVTTSVFFFFFAKLYFEPHHVEDLLVHCLRELLAVYAVLLEQIAFKLNQKKWIDRGRKIGFTNASVSIIQRTKIMPGPYSSDPRI